MCYSSHAKFPCVPEEYKVTLFRSGLQFMQEPYQGAKCAHTDVGELQAIDNALAQLLGEAVHELLYLRQHLSITSNR